MAVNPALLGWLGAACASYALDIVALYVRSGSHAWPLEARDATDSETRLKDGGHFLPLPKEPAALANILEVSVVDHLTSRFALPEGAVARRGTERGYPDLEFEGAPFGGGFHAVDVKIAMRQKVKTGGKPRKPSDMTQSRITLYTGNTYFRWPTLHWPGTFRAFKEYRSHVDVIGIYTLNERSDRRVDDLELIVQEPWRIGSRQRSSTTREYIGAVTRVSDLRDGRGDFSSEEEFYKFWRGYPFKIGKAVENQLQKLLTGQSSDRGNSPTLPSARRPATSPRRAK